MTAEVLEGRADFSFRDLHRGVPLVVWLLLALHGLVFASYAVLVPYYRSPDEIQHVDMAVHLQRETSYPRPQERQISLGVMNSTVEAGYGAEPSIISIDNRPLTADRARSRASRPTFDELGGDQPYVKGNQMGQHPPLYYAVAGAVLRLVPGSSHWPWDRVVHALRLLSVLFVIPLPLLAFLTARRLGAAEGAAVTASAFTLAIPELAGIGSSVNNDNLLVLLVGSVTMLVAYVATGDASRRTALLVGGLGAAALLTKGLALFVPFWIALVYAIAAWRYVDARFVRRGAIATAIAGGVGGLWWLRNLVEYGAVQPRGLVGPPLASTPARPYTLGEKGWSWFTEAAAPQLSSRFWVEHSISRTCTGPTLATCKSNDGAGWIQSWTTVATLLTLALVVVAVIACARRRTIGLGPVVAISVPFAAALAQLLVVDWIEFSHNGAASGLQGRYLYLGLVGLGVLFGIGAGVVGGRIQRWLPLVVLALAAVVHIRTIEAVLGYHWRGDADGIRAALDSAAAWSALPTALTRATWAAAVLLALAVVAALLRRRQGQRTV